MIYTKNYIDNIKPRDLPIDYLQKCNEVDYREIINDIVSIAKYYEGLKRKSPIDNRLLELLAKFVDYIEVERLIIHKLTDEAKFYKESAMFDLENHMKLESILIEKFT